MIRRKSFQFFQKKGRKKDESKVKSPKKSPRTGPRLYRQGSFAHRKQEAAERMQRRRKKNVPKTDPVLERGESGTSLGSDEQICATNNVGPKKPSASSSPLYRSKSPGYIARLYRPTDKLRIDVSKNSSPLYESQEGVGDMYLDGPSADRSPLSRSATKSPSFGSPEPVYKNKPKRKKKKKKRRKKKVKQDNVPSFYPEQRPVLPEFGGARFDQSAFDSDLSEERVTTYSKKVFNHTDFFDGGNDALYKTAFENLYTYEDCVE